MLLLAAAGFKTLAGLTDSEHCLTASSMLQDLTQRLDSKPCSCWPQQALEPWLIQTSIGASVHSEILWYFGIRC